MKNPAKSEIARFAPAKVIVRNTPSLVIGLCLAAGALAVAFNILGSDLGSGRSRISAPFALGVFAVAAVCVFGRGLIDASRSGPAIEIENGTLRAFTTGFGEMPLSEITHARAIGRGHARRVVVFGQSGPRLVIRVDLMDVGAKAIVDAIMAAKNA